MAAAQNSGQDGGIKTPTAATAQSSRSTAGPSRYDTFRDRERKIGHRRIDEGGVVTYKKVGGEESIGNPSWGIIFTYQLKFSRFPSYDVLFVGITTTMK